MDSQTAKQKVKYKQPLFQYEIYPVRSRTDYLEPSPWHWHSEFEICYVISGSIIYRTQSYEYTLNEGDVVFVNSGVMHSVVPVNPSDNLVYSVHFIDDIFISGGRGNAFDIKYVFPIKDNKSIEMIYFNRDEEKTSVIRNLIKENIKIKKKKDKYWEFKIRNNISEFWQYLVAETEDMNQEIHLLTVRDQSLRAAMTYIQEHYTEKIGLEELASYAHISTRECSRLFKKHLNITPMNYLYLVRLQNASLMLLDENKSISDVALENGFSGGSHFAKLFKAQFNITPYEYRSNMRNKK